MASGEDDETEQEWRSIVENFGDRAELEDEPASAEPAPAEPPKIGSVFDGPVFNPTYDAIDRTLESEQGFVAPDPGWQPLPERPRLLAWIGLFLAPAFLLVAAILQLHVAGWLIFLVIVGFLGGFGYLVWQMPSGPRDPWDDGSRI